MTSDAVTCGYRRWRAQGLTATHAIGYARAELAYSDTLARFGAWEFGEPRRNGYGAFAFADLDDAPDGFTVRVLIGDDDHGVDWGDCEPTDAEREAAHAFYLAVVVLDESDDDREVYHDGIGGVDVIDLPGYLQRDWEDAAAYALAVYLLDGAERFARDEPAERAYWAARDVATV